MSKILIIWNIIKGAILLFLGGILIFITFTDKTLLDLIEHNDDISIYSIMVILPMFVVSLVFFIAGIIQIKRTIKKINHA